MFNISKKSILYMFFTIETKENKNYTIIPCQDLIGYDNNNKNEPAGGMEVEVLDLTWPTSWFEFQTQ